MEEKIIKQDEIKKLKFVNEFYISKDVIREKIKELEEEGEKIEIRKNFYSTIKNIGAIEILKELLENKEV